MKKNAFPLSAFLIMLLVLMGVSASAFADECTHSGGQQLPSSGAVQGTYCLSADQTLTGQITVESGTATVCLNGNLLNCDKYGFTVASGATLNIHDCAGGGTIRLAASSADTMTGVTVKAGGVLNFLSGNMDLLNNSNYGCYGYGIRNDGGTVNVSGGTFCAELSPLFGTSTSSTLALVYAPNGVTNITGGSFIATVNVSSAAGSGNVRSIGVWSTGGTVNITGGSFKGDNHGSVLSWQRCPYPILAQSDGIYLGGSPSISGVVCLYSFYGSSHYIHARANGLDYNGTGIELGCVNGNYSSHKLLVSEVTEGINSNKFVLYNDGSIMGTVKVHKDHVVFYTSSTNVCGGPWDEGTVTMEPTCAANGVKTFTCEICYATKTEAIERLPHGQTNDTERLEISQCLQGDEAGHRLSGTEYAEKVCTICGEVTESVPTSFENRIAPHEYEDGICGVCGYACAHGNKETYGPNFFWEEIVEITAHNHVLKGSMIISSYCPDCDTYFDDQVIEENVIRREIHGWAALDNDVLECEICHFPLPCAHDGGMQYVYWEASENGCTYSNITAATHDVTGELYWEGICDLCNTIADSGTVTGTATVPHSYSENDVCRQCGYTRTCTHGNMVPEEAVDITTMWGYANYTDITETTHTCTNIVLIVEDCPDCDYYASRPKEPRTEASEVQPHTFAGNTCIFCSYVNLSETPVPTETPAPTETPTPTETPSPTPGPIIVASGKAGADVEWTLDENGTLTFFGTGDMYDYNNFQAPFEAYSDSVKNVLVSPRITSVGDYMFYRCRKLESVSLPQGITRIGNSAFCACGEGLTSLTLPESVTIIGSYAFASDYLVNINIPAGVTKIGYYPMGDRRPDMTITCVIGSSGASCLGGRDCAFVDSDYPDYKLIQHTDENGNLSLSIVSYLGSTQNVEIPAAMNSIPVIGIEAEAFYGNTNITRVVVPDGVTYIGDDYYAYKGSFSGCTNMAELILPDSVTYIGYYAFENCSSLKSVDMPDSLDRIDMAAFRGCTALESVDMPDSMSSIASSVFKDCTSLRTIDLPAGIPEIESSLFENCTSLDGVVIPAGVTEIGYSAFENCTNLTEIVVPEGVTHIWGYAFSNCTSLKSVSLPQSLTEIGCSEYAFSGMDELRFDAFGGCINLTEIVIPQNVTFIDMYTFRDCTSLKKIVLPDNVAALEQSFSSIASDANIYCNVGSVTAQQIVLQEYGVKHFVDPDYSKIRIWAETDDKGESSIIVKGAADADEDIIIPDAIKSVPVTAIADSAFKGNNTLKSVTIPEGVTGIGSSAFSDCTALEEITLPESVARIDLSAFAACTSLREITIPGSVTKIGNSVFSGCTSLTKVVIEEGAESIGEHIFHGCTNLTDVTLPDSLKEICRYAFYGCEALESITLPDNVTYVGRFIESGSSVTLYCKAGSATTAALANSGYTYSFVDPDYPAFKLKQYTAENGAYTMEIAGYIGSAEKVIIPDKIRNVPVLTIGQNAFYNCTSLEHVAFYGDNVSVDLEAFSNCDALKYITFSGEAVSLGSRAFCSHSANEVHIAMLGVEYPSSDNTVFSDNTAVTVYCYQYCGPQYWAEDNGCDVVFLDDAIEEPLEKIILQEDCRLKAGSGMSIDYSIFPMYSDYPLKWESSDEEIVSVNDRGQITVLTSGEATVTCSDPCGEAVDSVVITAYIAAESFDLSDRELWLISGETAQVTIENLTPANTNAILTWSSSDPTCAPVDENGLITARRSGTTSITATFENGVSRSCMVNVCGPVTALSFAEPVVEVPVTTEVQLTANVTTRTQQQLVNRLVVFTSAAPEVATVDGNGRVTGHAWGTTTITATAASGVSASCEVIVTHAEHKWFVDEAVAPNCNEDGLTEGKHCFVCLYVETAQETVPALGHSEVTDEAVAPTCVTTGLTEGSHCSVCGIVIIAQEIIPVVEVNSVLKLPAMLDVIEEEAFEGSSFECVVIPDGCTRIEARAFADCSRLQFVEILASVIHIDDTAFEGCGENLVIITSAESEAKSFAEKHGVKCVVR